MLISATEAVQIIESKQLLAEEPGGGGGVGEGEVAETRY